MIRILFGVVAGMGLLMALGTVLARNLVHAALYLVGFFFLIACTFVLLEAEFMAAMQVLVYIGAVSILMMFGIMLTRNIQGDETTGGSAVGKVIAGGVGLGMLAVLVIGIIDDKGTPARPAWSVAPPRTPAALVGTPNQDARSTAINDMARTVGNELMTRYAVAFEVAGLLLTAALVGAIALAQGEGETLTPRLGGSATLRTETSPEIHGDASKAGALTTTTGAPR